MKRIFVAATLAACAGLAAAQSIRMQANLELLFVTAKRGGYLADVQVSVYAADRSAPVVQLLAEGPVCMISAPAATYCIEASSGGVKRSVQVVANARQARVVFGFPEEPWDGVKASDEEKQQARSQ